MNAQIKPMTSRSGRLAAFLFILIAVTLSACSSSGSSSSGTPGISVTTSDSGLLNSEGGSSATYTIALTSLPSDIVNIALSPDTQLTVLPVSLTFTATNWNQPQIVIVAAIDDEVAEGNHTGLISHGVSSADTNYNQYALSDVTVNITDNDAEGVTLTATAGSTQVTEGGASDSYSIALSSQPAADTVITLNGGGQVSLSPTTLTFNANNWSATQTVTVTAVDDAAIEGAHNTTITHSTTSADAKYNTISIPSVTVDIIDNDTIATINFVGSDAVIQEGASVVSIPLRLNLNAPVSIASPVSASITSFASTATNSADFTPLSGGVTFPAGATDNSTQLLHISIQDDASIEALEHIEVRISAVNGAGVAAGTALDYHIQLHDNNRRNLIATDLVNFGGYSLSRLLSIDASSGASQRQAGAGLAGFPALAGIAFNSTTNTLYALSQDELIKFNIYSGTGGVIGFSSVSGALTYDSNTNTLYASDGASLYRINTSTGAATMIGSGFGAFSDVRGLTFDTNANVLYGSDTTANNLLTINTSSGAATAVGALGVTALSGLAFDANSNVLYASSTSQDKLYTVNTTSGAASEIGALGFGDVALLTHDKSGNTLYGFDGATRQLITLNTSSGAGLSHKVTGLGNSSGTQLTGLAYNSPAQIYYGVSANPLGEQYLVQVHANTGTASSIAKLSGVTGTLYDLAYDPNTETLYGVNGGSLYRINTSTAVATSIGNTGGNPHGLAFDPNSNILYASDTNTDELISLDTSSGAKTVKGLMGYGDVEGLAFDASGVLYGINTDPSGKDPRLITLDTNSGLASLRGAVLHEGMSGALAYDDTNGRLYGANQLGLLSLDTSNGRGTTKGQLGLGFVGDLAFDPNSGAYYAVANDNDDGKLVSINLNDGSSTPIGALGRACCVDGLAFDPNTNQLYAVDTGTGELLSINTSSGAVSVIGSGIGFDLINGALAFDPNTNTLYGIGATDIGCCGTGPYTYELITINTTSGAGAVVGPITGFDGITALAFDPAGILYGFDETSGQLITLNTGTGAASAVGSTGYSGIQGLTWRY